MVRRRVTIFAAGARTAGDAAAGVVRRGRRRDAVRASGLDWTISRPPRLLDRRLRRRYRIAYEKNVRTGMFIARSDVAAHMLAVTVRPATVGRVIGIAY